MIATQVGFFFVLFFLKQSEMTAPPQKMIFPHRRSWVQERFTNAEQGVVSLQKQPASVYSQQCHYLRNRRRGGEREPCPLCGQQSGAERSGEERRGRQNFNFFLIPPPLKKTLQTWVCTAPTRNCTPWARGVTRDRIWRAGPFETRCSPVGTASRTSRTAEGTPTPPSPGAPCTAGGSGRWKSAAAEEAEVEWGETFEGTCCFWS